MKYELSEEQVGQLKNILNESNGHSAHYIRTEIKHNLLPELFKSALEVGKWYRDNRPQSKSLFLIEKLPSDGRVVCVGFGMGGNWSDSCSRMPEIKQWPPATDEEVKTALIEEAKKRGFVEGVKFAEADRTGFVANGSEGCVAIVKYFIFNQYDNKENVLLSNGRAVFSSGKWATIIKKPQPKKVTLSEIEEKCGCKVEIVNA